MWKTEKDETEWRKANTDTDGTKGDGEGQNIRKECDRRAENGREQTETDRDGQRMFENKFYVTCSVYKSGKLCSYSLACNQTKPPVSWPRSTLNPQSLSVSVPASQPHSQSLHYSVNPVPSVNQKTPTFCEARAQHISWGQVFHPYVIRSASSPVSSLRSALVLLQLWAGIFKKWLYCSK